MGNRFEGRVVIVTGAGGGMGRTMALAFGRESARLVVSDIDAALLEETVQEAQAEGIECAAIALDLSDEQAIHAFGAKVHADYGKVDVLLNNGAYVYGDVNTYFETLSQEQWLRFLSVNTVSPLLVAQALRPALTAAKGVIINQSSMASYMPINCYGVSKAALNAMTFSMAHAFAKDGIRVNAVAPGVMLTPAGIEALKEEKYAQIRGTQLIPDVGVPQNIADVTMFLASDEGRFINCEIISCDGGSRIRGWRY